MDISELRKNFLGKIITKESPEYEHLRFTFSHEGIPAYILQPQNSEDIVKAVIFAKENKMVLSVRSGGHSGGGFSTNKGGVVIDLHLLNQVEVLNEESGLVRIGAGAVWGDVAEKLREYNLGISSGDTKSVGVGGLTLGGGIGWMVRKYGLALDSLVSVEIITAEGSILQASETVNPDLFWAVRGGGGNFGIVAYFEFKVHQLGKIFTQSITYKLENPEKVLIGWRDFMRLAPDGLSSTLMILPAMGPNPSMIIISNCLLAEDETKATEAFRPLLSLGNVLNSEFKEKKYVDILETAHKPAGMKYVSHNAFIKQFNNEVIHTLSGICGGPESPMLMLRSLGGQMNRIKSDATAFAHRDNEVFLVLVRFMPISAPPEVAEQFEKVWKSIKNQTSGCYVNFMLDSTVEELAEAYPPETYKKLAMIKKKYDPENLFNQNYNIQPSE